YTAAPVDNYSIPQRTLFIAYQLFFYPWKAVVPAKLSACYAYPQLANGSLPLEYYIAPVFLVLSIGLLWMVRKKSRDIFWGPVVYFLTLSPVLQLIPFNNASLVADRYAYLPIIGLAFLFSQLAGMAAEAISHLSVTLPDLKKVILSLAAFALIVPSVQRIHVWENGLTLFDDVIQKNDRIGIAYGNRADAKLKNGDFAAALADCNQLVALRPNDGLAFYDRGNALSGLHRYRDAVENFTHAIGLGFSNSSVYYNRGIAYYNLGTVDSAVSDFHTSRSFDAHFADAPYSLGYAALYSSGNARDAAAYFDTALAINPEYAEASYQKAHAEYDIRLYGNAMEDLSNAISARPELKNDPLVSDVNRAIDSINAVISKIKALQPKSAESIESRNHLHELYVMLGDSLRAHEIPGSPKARSDERDRR
ncbi:MAG TPA: tetratricopeptide repeat protein, partial [Bacteroidota bacterium]|nr:tetratricopeptide repeat protein [Bacteroidota bacterium]